MMSMHTLMGMFFSIQSMSRYPGLVAQAGLLLQQYDCQKNQLNYPSWVTLSSQFPTFIGTNEQFQRLSYLLKHQPTEFAYIRSCILFQNEPFLFSGGYFSMFLTQQR